MITCVTWIAVSIPAEISPVNAPSFSQCMFCAPIDDIRSRSGFDGSLQINKRWANHDFVARVAGDHGEKIAKECGGLFRRFVHLPIGGN